MAIVITYYSSYQLLSITSFCVSALARHVFASGEQRKSVHKVECNSLLPTGNPPLRRCVKEMMDSLSKTNPPIELGVEIRQ